MLEFKDGQFVQIDELEVVPGYGDPKMMPADALEQAGWESSHWVGLPDGEMSVGMYRKLGHKQPDKRSSELLFDVVLNGQPFQEIYCRDEVAAMKCLIELAPLLSTAVLAGIYEELDRAAAYRDNLESGTWKPHHVPMIGGLFLGMANVKGNLNKR